MPNLPVTTARLGGGALVLIVSACATGSSGGPSDSIGASLEPNGPGTPRPSIAVPEPVAMLVDTDVAPDDLVALAFLVSSPNVEIVAITVSGTGEAHCGPGAEVVLELLDELDAPDIPVACGRETPLEGTREFPAEWRAGADSGSGLSLPDTERLAYDATAVELMNEAASATDGLVILTLGPLTNLGDALQVDPSLAERVAGLTVMGGALFVPGNVGEDGAWTNTVAEWNVYVDPRALEITVAAGLMPDLVSLDGTNQVPVTSDFGRRVADEASTPAAQVLVDLFAANPWMTAGDYYLWDPLAAMLAAGYEVGSFSPETIAVELTDGPEWGFTRPVDGEPNVTYLAEADAEAAENVLIGVLNGL